MACCPTRSVSDCSLLLSTTITSSIISQLPSSEAREKVYTPSAGMLIYALKMRPILPLTPSGMATLSTVNDFLNADCSMSSQRGDRKSTRLNSSHANISYAVFCLKKKKKLCHHILHLHYHLQASIIHL